MIRALGVKTLCCILEYEYGHPLMERANKELQPRVKYNLLRIEALYR